MLIEDRYSIMICFIQQFNGFNRQILVDFKLEH